MTNHKTIEQWAEEFAVENRGYDFFKNEEPFAIEMKNCFLAGAAKQKDLLMPIIEEMRRLILSQERYTIDEDDKVVETAAFKRAMQTLESIEEKLKEIK